EAGRVRALRLSRRDVPVAGVSPGLRRHPDAAPRGPRRPRVSADPASSGEYHRGRRQGGTRATAHRGQSGNCRRCKSAGEGGPGGDRAGATAAAGRSRCLRRAARGGGVMSAPSSKNALEALILLLRALKLPAFVRYAEEIAQRATKEGWTFGQYLHHLAELEFDERRQRRIERLRRAPSPPGAETPATPPPGPRRR